MLAHRQKDVERHHDRDARALEAVNQAPEQKPPLSEDERLPEVGLDVLCVFVERAVLFLEGVFTQAVHIVVQEVENKPGKESRHRVHNIRKDAGKAVLTPFTAKHLHVQVCVNREVKAPLQKVPNQEVVVYLGAQVPEFFPEP